MDTFFSVDKLSEVEKVTLLIGTVRTLISWGGVFIIMQVRDGLDEVVGRHVFVFDCTVIEMSFLFSGGRSIASLQGTLFLLDIRSLIFVSAFRSRLKSDSLLDSKF